MMPRQPLPPMRLAALSRLPVRMALGFGMLFCAAITVLELVHLYGLPGTAIEGSMDELLRDTGQTLGRMADFKKEQVTRWLAERRANTRLMAANSSVSTALLRAREILAATPPGQSQESVRSRLAALPEVDAARQYMERVRNSYQVFSSITLVDAQSGRVLVATPGTEGMGRDVSTLPLMVRAREPGQTEVIASGEAGPSRAELFMARQIDEPLPNGDSRLLGVMIFRFNLRQVLMLSGDSDAQVLGRTGEITVFAPDGTQLARITGGAASDTDGTEVPANLIRLAAEGNEGTTRARGRSGRDIVADYRHIRISPELGWPLVVSLDEAEVLAPIERDVMRRMAFSALLLAVVLVLTAFLARFVSNPIRSLSRAARAVERGDFSARAQAGGGGEMEILARTFNSMVESLGQMHAELERLVEERTRALQEEIVSRTEAEAHVRALLGEKAALLDNTMVAIFTTKHRVVTACNHHFSILFGYDEAEVLGRSVSHLYPDEGQYNEAGAILYGGLAARGHVDIDFKFRRKDGETFWGYLSGRALEPGRPDGPVVWMMTDISARKAAEEALIASQERYRELIQGTNAVFTIVDPAGRFLFVNDAAAGIFGLSAADCIGRSALDFVHPDDRESTTLALRDWLSSGAENVEFENRQISSDGRVSYLAWTIRVHRDESGIPLRLSSVARDTTELRRAQTDLRLTQFSVDNAGEAICWMAEDMTVLYANAAAHDLLNCRGRTVVGEPLSTLVGEEFSPQWYGVYDILAQGSASTFETQVRTGQGRAINVEVTATKLLFDDHERRCAFFRDISVRKEAEERLLRTNAELEQFAFITSHDLREPLRTINIYLELVSRRLGPVLDTDTGEFMAFVRQAATRMDSLVRDLLEYSRTGRNTAPHAAIDLFDVLVLARSHLMGPLEECGASIELPDILPSVMGDEGELVRLFQNLIGNAVKYRSADRPLRISILATRQDNGWRFCVVDNGIGIEPEYRDRIFRVFQRLHPAGSHGGGTGIGLAICKRIVEQHGGRIWVESTPGQGSAFFFTLPEDGAPQPPALPAPPQGAIPLLH